MNKTKQLNMLLLHLILDRAFWCPVQNIPGPKSNTKMFFFEKCSNFLQLLSPFPYGHTIIFEKSFLEQKFGRKHLNNPGNLPLFVKCRQLDNPPSIDFGSLLWTAPYTMWNISTEFTTRKGFNKITIFLRYETLLSIMNPCFTKHLIVILLTCLGHGVSNQKRSRIFSVLQQNIFSSLASDITEVPSVEK